MSTNQYPEHLNPFAEDGKHKTGLRLKNSFREFGKTLRRSFRRKSRDEDVEIRRRPQPARPSPLSYQENIERTSFSPPLPRSRFQERLTKSQLDSSRVGKNPFEENETQQTTIAEEKMSTLRKKGKKQAPLPPKSNSSQNINSEDNLHVPTHTSAWSLTSADTDFSDYPDNISGSANVDIDRLSMTEKIIDLRKEIQKLNEYSNNNNRETEDNHQPEDAELEVHKSNNTEVGQVPDLVISCPNSDSENNNTTHNGDCKNGDSADSSENIVVKDITNNLQNPVEEIENEAQLESNENSDILYYEKKSLYIAGSRDELNEDSSYTGRVSLYITGSKDNLCNNNNSNSSVEEIGNNNNNNNIDEKSESATDDSNPVPKQRRNKPTKSFLLGTAS